MKALDSDGKLLVASNGTKAQRDIVQVRVSLIFAECMHCIYFFNIQFVAMRNYQTVSRAQLAKDVLAEVPRQFLSYMRFNQIQPNSVYQRNNELLSSNTTSPLPTLQEEGNHSTTSLFGYFQDTPDCNNCPPYPTVGCT